MEQNKLDKILKDHKIWVNADLRNANLWNADLWYANLWYANLRNANLRNADLWYADLRNADLRYAVGNGKEVISLQVGIYPICITKDLIFVGCMEFNRCDVNKIKYKDVKYSVSLDEFKSIKRLVKAVLKEVK